MEDQQFDVLTRRLSAAASRRHVLAGLVVSSGLLAAGGSDAGRKKNKRKHPRRKKKNRHGTTTTGPGLVTTATTSPPFCAGKPDETYCGVVPAPPRLEDWFLCSGGVCAQYPDCAGLRGAACTTGAAQTCCSDFCDDGRCACSAPGDRCKVTADCCGSAQDIQVCVGFVCREVSP